MMKGWETVTLESVCTKVTDGTHDTPEVIESGFPLIKGKDISKGFIDFENCDHVSEAEHLAIIKRSHPEKGDILFSNIGSVGDCVYINTDKEFSIKNVALFKADSKKILPRFLYYVVSGEKFTGEILAKKSGSAQPFISLGVLRSQKISVPPLPTQKRIAGILSAYDDLIENNLKRIKLLEELAQITYEEWFVRFRFPGHESTPINPTTNLPEGWEITTCYDAMEVMSGGTPKTGTAEYWNGRIPFYTPKDAVDSSYVFETEKYVTELGVSKCNSKLYPRDTVFITARGTVGKVNLAGQPMAMNQSCYALAGKKEISTYFLFFAVKASIEAFKGASNGGVFNTIVVDTFRYLPFKKPTQDLMKRFEDFVSPILVEVSNLTQQNSLLREARDILLPRLMTGMIDVDQYHPENLMKDAA